jgi:hypothetical protein
MRGYRIIARRDGPTVRLYRRNAYDWKRRLAAIDAAAERIKAKSPTIDGEAVVLGPDGLSRFDELSRREAADTAILYAFNTSPRMGRPCSPMRAGLALRASYRRRSMAPTSPACARSGSRSVIQRVSPCSASAVRSGIDDDADGDFD